MSLDRFFETLALVTIGLLVPVLLTILTPAIAAIWEIF